MDHLPHTGASPRRSPCAALLPTLLLLSVLAHPLEAQQTAQPVALSIQSDARAGSTMCCSEARWYVDAAYLFWWTRGTRLPPLVTMSPHGTEIDQAGVLGEPGTVTLYGDERVLRGPRSGVQLRTGVALGDAGCWWLTADGLALPTYENRFSAASSGEPILGRPFFDPVIGLPNAELIAFPGLVAGRINAEASNEVWGAGAALQRNVLCCDWEESCGGYRTDLLIGYRYLALRDTVAVREHLTATDPAGPLVVGTQLSLLDRFHSESEFHGVELGLRGETVRNRYFLVGDLRVAFGESVHRLDVDGWTRVVVPGAPPVSFPGGLLATEATLGTHRDREFAVVPQAELRLGRYLTDHVRVSVGYNFLYWSQAVRAAEHIHPVVGSTQLPSADHQPAAHEDMVLTSSSFWAQGISAHLEWEY